MIKKLSMVLILSIVLVASLGASTITLNGNNALPGWLEMTVDGQSVKALDYTGQRWATQGQTWTANVLTFSELPMAGYYGPNDPILSFADYQIRYKEWIYLFNRLKTDTNPDQVVRIQDAVYFISGAAGFAFNGYVQEANNAIANGYNPDTSAYRFINTPLTDRPLVQGFMYEVPGTDVPEPGTLIFMGIGLIVVGTLRRR